MYENAKSPQELLDKDEVIDCGIPHPIREFNTCVKDAKIAHDEHEDLEGRTWKGSPVD